MPSIESSASAAPGAMAAAIVEEVPVAAPPIPVVVHGLSGSVVTEMQVGSLATGSTIKDRIAKENPAHATCWQRLLCQGRELHDQDQISDLDAPRPVMLTLVVSVDPSKLLVGSTAAVAEAASALEAMGTVTVELMARLFVDESGEPLPASVVEELLDTLGHTLFWDKKLVIIRIALLPHAMHVLKSTAVVFQRRNRLNRVFGWMGSLAAPHLVAWLGLLERPVQLYMTRRVEQLSRFPDSARVRLAAKSALKDKGGTSVSRVDELANLRASLARDIKSAAHGECETLEAFRASARAALLELQTQSGDIRVRYAASRALKR